MSEGCFFDATLSIDSSHHTGITSHEHHRIAAIASRGYKTIPVRIICPIPIEIWDAEHWTQVKNDVWKQESAIHYFNHLFDLDGRAWTQERNLLPPTS